MLPIGLSARTGGLSALGEALAPLLRGSATLFITALGTTLCGMIGSLAYPVGGAAVGCFMGVAISLTMGCAVTGFWRDVLPGDGRTFGVGSIVPHSLAVQLGAHGKFDLIVTVHEALGVRVQGHMPWRRADLYVELECGSNPIKRTCVKKDSKFNEQFKIQVTSTDEGVLCRIKDQDVFGASNIGYVYVDIQRDIIDAGFPSQKEFPIEAGESDWLRWNSEKALLILSFDYTEDYPKTALRGTNTRSSQSTQSKVLRSKGYGAVSFLTQLEFNHNVAVAKRMEEADARAVQDFHAEV